MDGAIAADYNDCRIVVHIESFCLLKGVEAAGCGVELKLYARLTQALVDALPFVCRLLPGGWIIDD